MRVDSGLKVKHAGIHEQVLQSTYLEHLDAPQMYNNSSAKWRWIIVLVYTKPVNSQR